MALERPRFSTTKLTEGYDMAEVDDAIDRIFDALAEPVPPMTPADVASLRFTPVRLRQGYSIDEVDQWLDVAGAELARRAGGPTAPEHDVRASAAAPAPATRSDAITEVQPASSRALLVLGVLVVLAVVAYALFA